MRWEAVTSIQLSQGGVLHIISRRPSPNTLPVSSLSTTVLYVSSGALCESSLYMLLVCKFVTNTKSHSTCVICRVTSFV